MIFSISSVFITLCVSLLLIALFSFILTHEKSYRLFLSIENWSTCVIEI